jgi:hypothetical protein
MTSKPDFIIVPGAWHGPDSFGPTTEILEKAGYTVHGISLAASNGPPRMYTFLSLPEVQQLLLHFYLFPET